jgi:ATP-dependent Lhr-like helicase
VGFLVVGLDTECTLTSRTLCLIQMASREATYLIDALEFADLEPSSRILASTETTKLVHDRPTAPIDPAMI